MSYKMSEFPSISEVQVTKLREAGIENTDDMMRVWADQPKRAALVDKSGIDMERFAKIASMARLARVKHVGPKYVELLLAAGVDGPKSLFEFEPDALVKRLVEVTATEKLTFPVPTLEEVGVWFADSKPVAAAAK